MSLIETLLIKTVKARAFIRDHEAGIEIGAGIACYALSVALAARAGIKSKEVIDEYKEADNRNIGALNTGVITITDEDGQQEMVEYNQDKYLKDKAKLKRRTAGKLVLTWLPSALGFAGGTGLVLRSHHVMVKSNLGLAAALKASEEALEKYRAKTREKIGDEAEKNLYEGKEIVTTGKGKNKKPECLQGTPLSTYARLISRDTLAHDCDWCVSSDDYNMSRMKDIQRWANRQLQINGRVTFNQVLEHIGLELSEDGDVVGWRSTRIGGKTDDNGIIFEIHKQIGGDVNNIHYVKDEWADGLVRAADPFWVDFNVEGCILGASTLRKLGA